MSSRSSSIAEHSLDILFIGHDIPENIVFEEAPIALVLTGQFEKFQGMFADRHGFSPHDQVKPRAGKVLQLIDGNPAILPEDHCQAVSGDFMLVTIRYNPDFDQGVHVFLICAGEQVRGSPLDQLLAELLRASKVEVQFDPRIIGFEAFRDFQKRLGE